MMEEVLASCVLLHSFSDTDTSSLPPVFVPDEKLQVISRNCLNVFENV